MKTPALIGTLAATAASATTAITKKGTSKMSITIKPVRTGKEVILVDTGVPEDFPFGEPTEDATIFPKRHIRSMRILPDR